MRATAWWRPERSDADELLVQRVLAELPAALQGDFFAVPLAKDNRWGPRRRFERMDGALVVGR